MASRSVRTIGWLLAGDIAFILFLVVLGLVLHATRIPIDGNAFVTEILGAHGLVFDFVPPPAVYSVVRVAIIWIIAWAVTTFRR